MKIFSSEHFAAGNYTIKLFGTKSNVSFKFRKSGGEYEEILTEGNTATFVVDADGDYDLFFSTLDSVAQTFTAAVYAN